MTAEHVGAYEAKTHLPRLLDEVERGESITITKHGRAIARLVPVKEVLINAVPSEDVPGEMSDGAQLLWAYRVIRRKRWGSSIARRVRRSRNMIDQRFPKSGAEPPDVVIEALRAARVGVRRGEESVRTMIEEGRR